MAGLKSWALGHRALACAAAQACSGAARAVNSQSPAPGRGWKTRLPSQPRWTARAQAARAHPGEGPSWGRPWRSWQAGLLRMLCLQARARCLVALWLRGALRGERRTRWGVVGKAREGQLCAVRLTLGMRQLPLAAQISREAGAAWRCCPQPQQQLLGWRAVASLMLAAAFGAAAAAAETVCALMASAAPAAAACPAPLSRHAGLDPHRVAPGALRCARARPSSWQGLSARTWHSPDMSTAHMRASIWTVLHMVRARTQTPCVQSKAAISTPSPYHSHAYRATRESIADTMAVCTFWPHTVKDNTTLIRHGSRQMSPCCRSAKSHGTKNQVP